MALEGLGSVGEAAVEIERGAGLLAGARLDRLVEVELAAGRGLEDVLAALLRQAALAVAVAISLFGLNSGAALATVGPVGRRRTNTPAVTPAMSSTSHAARSDFAKSLGRTIRISF